ncbi:MAG: hypothetical protein EDM82_07665 [Cyanobacteria bacterium CYA]|nr:MAG: hypothetical protein EDM82_07665 [Cyanobacteria bacterium CYA]
MDAILGHDRQRLVVHLVAQCFGTVQVRACAVDVAAGLGHGSQSEQRLDRQGLLARGRSGCVGHLAIEFSCALQIHRAPRIIEHVARGQLSVRRVFHARRQTALHGQEIHVGQIQFGQQPERADAGKLVGDVGERVGIGRAADGGRGVGAGRLVDLGDLHLLVLVPAPVGDGDGGEHHQGRRAPLLQNLKKVLIDPRFLAAGPFLYALDPLVHSAHRLRCPETRVGSLGGEEPDRRERRNGESGEGARAGSSARGASEGPPPPGLASPALPGGKRM